MRFAHDLNVDRLELIITELKVGETFAEIALETKNESTRVRNKSNARKAYDAVVRLASRTNLSIPDWETIKAGIDRLKQCLAALGETGLG